MQLNPQVLATDDFEIFEGERRAGRIYKLTFPDSERWHWHVYARGNDRGALGTADNLSEAVAAFCKALDAQAK